MSSRSTTPDNRLGADTRGHSQSVISVADSDKTLAHVGALIILRRAHDQTGDHTGFGLVSERRTDLQQAV